MSKLFIFDEVGKLLQGTDDYGKICDLLKSIGISIERWDVGNRNLGSGSQNEIMEAYKTEIETLNSKFSFKSMDVVSLTPDNPKKDEFRNMFLSEHTHSDFEIRFFVDGCGTFYIHSDDKVYAVICEKGDLISIPAETKHWFDMGTQPFFKAIRFFTIPEGWVGKFTGSDISKRIPTHDDLIQFQISSDESQKEKPKEEIKFTSKKKFRKEKAKKKSDEGKNKKKRAEKKGKTKKDKMIKKTKKFTKKSKKSKGKKK